MKDIKHNRRDFQSVTWVMPKGWDFGRYSRGWGSKLIPNFNQISCVSFSHEWHVQRHIFFVPRPCGLGEGPKGQISLDLNYKVNFKDV